jgi:hypothetical protein
MPEDLDTLLAQLAAAGDRFKTLRAQLDDARNELVPLLLQVMTEHPKVPQTRLVELSGYTRDRVRVIARNNGIERAD